MTTGILVAKNCRAIFSNDAQIQLAGGFDPAAFEYFVDIGDDGNDSPVALFRLIGEFDEYRVALDETVTALNQRDRPGHHRAFLFFGFENGGVLGGDGRVIQIHRRFIAG